VLVSALSLRFLRSNVHRAQGGGAAGASRAAPGGTAGRGAGQTSSGAGVQGCVAVRLAGTAMRWWPCLDELLSCACLRTVSDRKQPSCISFNPLLLVQAAEADKMAQFKALLSAGPIQIAKRQ